MLYCKEMLPKKEAPNWLNSLSCLTSCCGCGVVGKKQQPVALPKGHGMRHKRVAAGPATAASDSSGTCSVEAYLYIFFGDDAGIVFFSVS